MSVSSVYQRASPVAARPPSPCERELGSVRLCAASGSMRACRFHYKQA